MSQYELTGVGKAFNRGAVVVHALHAVDLTIEPGEFVALEGPSGSGKTTVLHLLGALDRPSSGSVIVETLGSLAADRGTTVIVATHDTGLADRAPRRLAMRDGALTPAVAA